MEIGKLAVESSFEETGTPVEGALVLELGLGCLAGCVSNLHADADSPNVRNWRRSLLYRIFDTLQKHVGPSRLSRPTGREVEEGTGPSVSSVERWARHRDIFGNMPIPSLR